MVAITFFDAADWIQKEDAFVSLGGLGTMKFNATAVSWMQLDKYKCIKVGHDSPGNPEAATKIFFVPNNDEEIQGVNFKFCKSSQSDKTFSCRRVIYQNPNLVSLLKSKDADERRMYLSYDDKNKLHYYEVAPQFCRVLTNEYFYKANNISCLYSLYQNNNRVYIGETCDLKQTISRHQNEGKKFDSIRYSILKNDESLRKYWERFYLLKFKDENQGELPKYNKVVPYEVHPEQKKLISIENRKVAVNETNVG